jgi:tRNA pseudouridine55 synthase
VNCIINLNKPKGITSHQAVRKVMRIAGVKKAGHAGTLDPMATGVLLVCTGEGTKAAGFLSDLDKEYAAMGKLGEKTDTFDSEGKVVERSEGFSCEREDIERILPDFIGDIEQTPPMFSAVKMGGKPLYKLARKGVIVERKKRRVKVSRIELTRFELPYFEITVSCSKGTYIRSLCNDIGEAVGAGAHMTELTRTRIGKFRIEDSITMTGLEQAVREAAPGGPENYERSIFDIDDALEHLRSVSLADAEFRKAKNGLPSRCPERSLVTGEHVRLKDPSGSLFAIGIVKDGLIRIERILHL